MYTKTQVCHFIVLPFAFFFTEVGAELTFTKVVGELTFTKVAGQLTF